MVTIQLDSDSSLKAVADCLNRGGTCLVPTDTVFGLCCLPMYEGAIDHIFHMKRRDVRFNLPVMVRDPSQLQMLGVEVNRFAEKLISSPYFPGPLTIVFGFSPNANRPLWLKGRKEVAVRIPDSSFLQNVMLKVGPLLMTSANMHTSKEVHYSIEQVLNELHGAPDLVVTGKRQTFQASTIINVRHSPPKIEREGEVPVSSIIKLLENEE